MAKPNAIGAVAPGKPLIFAENPFDALNANLDLGLVDQGWDDFYIPGYSEKLRINEKRVRDGLSAVPMDRLQWVRISRGTSDVAETDKSMYQWLRLGYRAVGRDYLQEKGYGFPPAASPAADGTIRIGDVALFMAPERQAEANRAADEILRKSKMTPSKAESKDGLEIIKDETRSESGKTLKEAYDAPLPVL